METNLRIRELRRKALLTQSELADKIGIKRTTLCHYETGRCRVPVSLLPEIRDALGCTWEELFDDENSPADGG